jgi:4-hydroxyphenylacetate 3-hydroxylase, reductase component
MTAAIAPDLFRDACSQFASGVAVVCLMDSTGTPHGMTVSSFTPVSLAPPIVLVCIDRGSSMCGKFRDARFFSVSALSAEQRHLSVAFAVKPEGRFEGVAWHAGEGGAPLIDGAISTLECRVTKIVDDPSISGDHAVVFGEVIGASVSPGDPLLYFSREYRRVG